MSELLILLIFNKHEYISHFTKRHCYIIIILCNKDKRLHHTHIPIYRSCVMNNCVLTCGVEMDGANAEADAMRRADAATENFIVEI